MKCKITGYRTGVFDKDGKKISYQHIYIENLLKAYRDVDVAAGYETIRLKVSDGIADYIERYIYGVASFPIEADIFFDMYGRVEDVNFDV